MEGRRVRLRPLRRADLKRRLEFTNDEEIQRFAAGEYIGQGDLHTIHTWFETVNADPRSRQLAVETAEDGRYIGDFDIHGIDPERKEAWVIPLFGDRAYWSGGYRDEAFLLVLRYAFEELGLERILTELVDVDTANVELAERFGFRRMEAIDNMNGTHSLIYELDAARFRELNPEVPV